MDRPFSEVIGAWIALIPSLVHLGARRARHLRPGESRPAVQIAGSSPAGSFSCEIGMGCPVMVDGRAIGRLSTNDDDGTSTAECALALDAGTDPEVVRLVIATATSAGFARGNHRTCWRVGDHDATSIAVLQDAGFTHEGKAPPLVQDPHTRQAWSRLSTDQTAAA